MIRPADDRRAVVLTPRNVPKLAGPEPPRDRVIWWDAAESAPSGFGLRVTATDARAYVIFYRAAGRQRLMTLGDPRVIDLAEARKRARAILAEAQKGADPLGAKREARLRGDTLGDLVQRFLDSREARAWRPKTRGEFVRLLRREVVPALGSMKPEDVGRRDVRALVERIADRGAPYVANRALGVAHLLFEWAVSKDILGANPAAGIDRPTEERERTRVLTEDEIRAFWSACDAEPGIIADAFRLMLVTAQRRGEVLSMRWQDIEGAWWTIPAERSKSGLPHRVPLSAQALAVLDGLRAKTAGGAWVFPSPRRDKTCIANPQKAADRLWRRAKVVDATIHDLRRTAASLMTGGGVPAFTVERVLGHARPKLEKTYDRASYDHEKRIALEAWGRRLAAILAGEDEQHAAVVPITAGRA